MNQLQHYDAGIREIALARSVDEVKGIRDKAEAIRQYARIADNRELEADGTEIRLRAERRLGEMLAEQEMNRGGWAERQAKSSGSQAEPQDRRPTLADVGISKKLSSRAQATARIPQPEFDRIMADHRRRIVDEGERVSMDLRKEAEKHVRGTFGTGDNQWFTPPEWIELARAVLGEIDLDPASHWLAQKAVRAKSFFTEEQNGLDKEWHGRIWLNPPYAQPAIEDFVDKIIREYQSRRTIEAIMLTHNYSDTSWYQKAGVASDAFCSPRGRIRFVSPDGELASPTQGQTIFYFGDRDIVFKEVFSVRGLVGNYE